ncbi:MAG: type II toxin-antitoxin system RelE/ParE family toxin [Bacteroidia bacterium]
MIVRVDKSFEKDTDKLKDRKLLQKIADSIRQVQAAKSPAEIQGLKKLSGFSTYYRIRIGEYRIGVFIKGNEAIFERCLHRKDIYRYYP